MPTYNFLRSLYGLWNKSTVLIATPSGTNDADGNPLTAPVSSDNPLPVTVVGGGTGGGGTVSFPKVTVIYSPQSLAVGTGQSQLSVPANATEATVLVVSGSVRRSIGEDASASTPMLSAGDSEEISGAELAAYRMTRDGGSNAQVFIEYRKVS